MTARQYRALADFRYELRLFLRFSEDVARQHGLTPLQYQMLLQVKGYGPVTIGWLAERLQAKHHGVVALVTRCETAGLVKRRMSPTDRRAVLVALTAKGERAVERLAHLHRNHRGRLIAPNLESVK